MKTQLALVLALTPITSYAALTFTDPSFENGASTDTSVGGNYEADVIDGNRAVSGMNTSVWNVNTINQLENHYQTLALRAASDLNPANVTGDQYAFGSIAGGDAGNSSVPWNDRTFFQYVDDNFETKGEITVAIDYWAHIFSGNGGDGSGQLGLEVIAFNDPLGINVDFGNASGNDYVNGAGTYISSATGLLSVSVVNASTGFQSFTPVTLDLGVAGYKYVGVAVTIDGFDNNRTATNGDTLGIDNLVVTTIPEPSAFVLTALAGFGLIIRRRR